MPERHDADGRGRVHLAALGILVALALAACGDGLEPPPSRATAVDRSALRPTDVNSNLMWRYTADEVVETYSAPDSGFLIHFTRTGVNAVPLADLDDSGVPDIVQTVNDVYDRVAAKYQGQMGYKAPLSDEALPDNGGDGRFDIYLIDFGLAADGNFAVDQCPATLPDKCAGYIQQENDFVGYGYPSIEAATTVLGSHEYFHAVQNAYDSKQGVVVEEGTAVWAEKQFDAATTRADFNSFVGGYLSMSDRSLDSPPPGPVPSFAYGSTIFFDFLSEKYGQDIILEMWADTENGHGDPALPSDVADPYWLRQLDEVLQNQHQSSFAEAFRTFATWNLFLGPSADPTQSYADCAAYPRPNMTAVTAPYQSADPLRVYYASTQYFTVPADGRAQMTAALVDDPTTEADETAGVELVLAPRVGSAVGSVVVPPDVKQGTSLVDIADGGTLIVAVVNTAHEGANGQLSMRPSLCIGTAAEVDACRTALGSASTMDGGADAGSPLDSGMPSTMNPPAAKGCSTSGQGAALMCVLLLVLKSHAGRRSRGML